MDESGESKGFHENSSRTFNVTLLKVESSKPLKRIVKNLNRKVLKAGWPSDIEIKAASLYGAGRNRHVPRSYQYKSKPHEPIFEFVDDLAKQDAEIDYLTIRKSGLKQSLKDAPPFVLYNYLTGILIERNAKLYETIHLLYDTRSKESRTKLKFDTYIQTTAFAAAVHPDFRFYLEQCDSQSVGGIEAVDIVSWAVHRKFEHGDSRFLDLLSNRIGAGLRWFF